MTSPRKPQSMSSVDAAWWRMEHPANLMMVTGVMYFEEKISIEAVRRTVQQRLLRFDRFRQRVADRSGGALRPPQWLEDAPLDMDWHVRHEVLPEPGGREALQRRAGELMSTPLDYDRPLWQVHLLDNCGTGNAILIRIHHCIADGMALVAVLLSLTGESAAASLEPPGPSPQIHFPTRAGDGSGGNRWTRKLWMAAKTPLSAINLAFKKPDPPTRFKGSLGHSKLAAWSAPIPLEEIKRVKERLGGTINDVLLAAMTGALRRCLEDQGGVSERLRFRAAVPVNLRPLDSAHELGNRFGLVFLELPVGSVDPRSRLRILKQNMDALKTSPEALVAFGILKLMGAAPFLQKFIQRLFGAKATAVMTNVPGPREPLYLGGKRVDHLMFWVPRAGRLGLGVSILSYAGTVRLGIAVDAQRAPNPNAIIDHFQRELEAMLALAETPQADAQA